jgi:U3 small nucleolar RNA-associated protein 14
LLLLTACDESDVPTVNESDVKKVDLGKVVESSQSKKSVDLQSEESEQEDRELEKSDSKSDDSSKEIDDTEENSNSSDNEESSDENDGVKDEYQKYSDALKSQIQTYGYGAIEGPPPVPSFGSSSTNGRSTHSGDASGDTPPSPPSIFK